MLEQSSNKIYTNEGNVDVLNKVQRKGSVILDVGCGGGSLAARLKQLGHVVDGITLSEAEKQAASYHCRGVYIHDLETGLPPEAFHEKYDYVVCSHVLEHIVYPKPLLEQIRKVLKPDGELIVALPNLMHYKSRFKLLAGNFNYEDAGIWDYTHVKWYTFESARKLMEHHGFEITFAGVTGELPLNSLWSKILPKQARKGLYKMLTAISKGLFGYQILITAKPVAES